MKNHKQVQLVNQMYNTLDCSEIVDSISEHIEYRSYWVILPITGKTKFLNFISKKLQTIKIAAERGDISIASHIVTIKGIENEFFVELDYTFNNEQRNILIRVEVFNSLITSIQLFPKKQFVTIKL